MIAPLGSLLSAVAAVTLAFGTAAFEGTTYRNEGSGFQVELPDGWSVAEVADAGATLHVKFTPAKTESVQLSVRVYPESSVGGPSAVRKLALDAVGDDERYSRQKLGTAVIGEAKDALAFQIDTRSDGGTLRVHQRYVTRNGRSYVLQSVARRASFQKLARRFDAIWATFELLEPTAEEADRRQLLALAARCGSQVHWAGSWAEAARRARTEHKLVLVTAWIYRGFNLPDATMGLVFTDPDVVELVNERYVPYRLTRELDVPFAAHDVYGMGRFTFGAAALLVTHEGEVVDEAGLATYGFLARGVDLHAAYPGPPMPSEAHLLTPLARAALRLRRGELEDAAFELALLEGPEAHRLTAVLDRRLYRAEEALTELGKARAASNDEAFEDELLVDEAAMLFRVGRLREGIELLRAFAAEDAGHAEHERLPEALYRLGAGRAQLEGHEQAEREWTRLIDDFPDSPWAWLAASTMTSTAYSIGMERRLEWPSTDDLAELATPDYERLPTGEALRAEHDAALWLLANQAGDGSWFTPTELRRDRDEPADDFKLAITAICAQSLIGRRADEEVARSIERALDWLVPAYERSFESGGEAFFMDYGVWSRAFVLACLAASVDAGLREAAALEATVGHLIAELAAKQKPGGGWSYYVKSDLSSSATSERSISFTTAAVVLALQRARRSGFDVPEALLEGGLDCLETTRTRPGVYEYFDDGAGSAGLAAGSAGRGPVCALALFRSGRVELDELREALGLFLAHRHGLDKERGKSLLHTGPDGQGSHYLLFDYWAATLALRELPTRQRGKYVEPLLELLLNTRCEGGVFVDNARRGVAYGTGMALAALESLRSSP